MKSYFIRSILLALLNILFGKLSGQTNSSDSLKADSLKRMLTLYKEDTNKIDAFNELSKILWRNKSEAIEYAKQALSLSKKISYKKGEGSAYLNYAIAQAEAAILAKGSFDEALNYINRAITIFTATGDNLQLGDCYFQLVVLLWLQTKLRRSDKELFNSPGFI